MKSKKIAMKIRFHEGKDPQEIKILNAPLNVYLKDVKSSNLYFKNYKGNYITLDNNLPKGVL